MGLAIFLVIAFVMLGAQQLVTMYRRSHPAPRRGTSAP
jgi:hypothetical protein